MVNNVLEDPLIRISTSNGSVVQASLPAVYAALMRDEIDAFPALRPHQRHAWHAFLVQLGALAIHSAGLNGPPDNADEWRRILRGLTADFPDDAPWQLVVEDITRPAFMQPSARSDDRLKDYKTSVSTPDGLDMLVLSKNHDIKSAVAMQAEADDWIFALITLQTMEGFGGAGNYGISRMNGGLGSRAAFSLTSSTRPGAHLRRDMFGLSERHASLVADYPMRDDGVALVWTLPWDGTKGEALLPDQLQPYYIEICRRIRLRVSAGGNLYGLRTSSKAARIEAKNLNGITGDPWMPINRKESKALTLANGGFTYKRVTEYLTSTIGSSRRSCNRPAQSGTHRDRRCCLRVRWCGGRARPKATMNASSQSAPKPNGRSCGERAWTSLAESPNPASKTSGRSSVFSATRFRSSRPGATVIR